MTGSNVAPEEFDRQVPSRHQQLDCPMCVESFRGKVSPAEHTRPLRNPLQEVSGTCTNSICMLAPALLQFSVAQTLRQRPQHAVEGWDKQSMCVLSLGLVLFGRRDQIHVQACYC